MYANSFEQELKFPCLAVVVSGGHTELVYMKEEYSFSALERGATGQSSSIIKVGLDYSIEIIRK